MDTVVNDFVQVLRWHQVRASPSESLDAMHALVQTGLGERGVVRDTLRTTLVKNSEDIETFDRLFDLYFGLRPTAEKRKARLDAHGHDHDHGEPTSMEFGEAEGEAPDSVEHSMDRAAEQVFSGRIIDAGVNGDFGRAAGQLRYEYLPSLNHRTTLVILGDGRNNGKAPTIEVLEEISHHVRQTIWITPEPKWGWPLGSFDMTAYQPICDRVEAVRSVDQLAGVAENLVRSRA